MDFILPTLQQTLKNSIQKQTAMFITLMALTICVLACVQDHLQASLLGQGYFLSESVLFKSFLLPIVPIVLLLWKHRSRFHRVSWPLFALPPIAAALHLLAYAAIVFGVSAWAFDHTYSFTGVLQRAIAEDLYKYILAYFLAVALIRAWHRTSSELSYPTRLIVQNGKESTALAVGEIWWIGSDDPYIAIHTKNRRHLSNITLKAMEAQLDPSAFIRIHRATIISIQQVESYRSRLNGDYDVRLKCGETVRASRRYSKGLRDQLSRYSAQP